MSPIAPAKSGGIVAANSSVERTSDEFRESQGCYSADKKDILTEPQIYCVSD
jgi:hypothetical protein